MTFGKVVTMLMVFGRCLWNLMRIRQLPTSLTLPRYTGKTLAVLSCALALLASHPLMAEAGTKEKPAAVRTIQDSPVRPEVSESVWNTEAGEYSSHVFGRKSYSSTQGETNSALKQAHLLAFIAQWGQLLWGNMTTVAAPDMLLAFAPVVFSEVGGASRSAVGGRTVMDLPPPCERVYVQRHCLLPPPEDC